MLYTPLTEIVNYKQNGITCPICNGMSKKYGKCRGNRDLARVWCGERNNITHADGYTLIDNGVSDPFWAKNIKVEYTEEQRRAYAKAAKERALEQARLEAEKLASKPDAIESDRQLRAVLKQTKIDPEFYQDLLKRGFSQAEIARLDVGVVRYGISYLGKLDKPMVGFTNSGKYVASTGLLLPCVNMDGLIHGYEIKNTSESIAKGFGKYVLVSTNKRHLTKDYSLDYRLKNGERPLDFNFRDTQTIIFCEGTLKAKLASFKTGFSFIGANSGYFTNSQSQLERLFLCYPNATYLYAPDAKSSSNPSVATKIIRSCQALAKAGIKVGLIDYGQWLEGQDIDEINHTNWSVRTLQDFQEACLTPVPQAGKVQVNTRYTIYNGEPVSKALARLVDLCLATGVKNIIFNAPTGVGKSHAAAEFMRDSDRVVYYFARSQKQPDNDLFKEFPRLASRNTELEEDEYFRGMTANNCHWTDKFKDAYSHGVDPSSLCGSCPFARECVLGSNSEKGYGFKNQYIYGVRQPKVLATTQGYQAEYQAQAPGGMIGIYEEASALTTVKTQKINQKTIADAIAFSSSLFASGDGAAIQTLLVLLGRLFTLLNEGTASRYGIDLTSFIETLKDLDTSHLTTAETHFTVALNKVNADYIKRGATPIYNFISPLVQRLTGNGNAQFHLIGKTIEVTTLDENLRNVVNGNILNIFLDATASKDALALQYGLDLSKTVEFSVTEAHYSNVEFYQVPLPAGRDIGKKATKAIDAVKKEINYKNDSKSFGLIDYLKRQERSIGMFDSNQQLTHHSDARGSNLFQDKDGLIIVDVAKLNLGAALRQYNLYTGRNVVQDDLGFKAYYESLISANMLQEIGRLRSMRRLDEILSVWLISDKHVNLPHGIAFKEVLPEAIGVTSYSRGEATSRRIVDTAMSIVQSGYRLTQQALAEALSVTISTVRRHLDLAGMTWKELKQKFVTIGNKIVQNIELTAEEDALLESSDVSSNIIVNEQVLTKKQRRVTLLAIRLLTLPKPVRNRVMASYNSSFREAILKVFKFLDLMGNRLATA